MSKKQVILCSFILLLLVGCTNQTSSDENQKLKEEVNHLKFENETLTKQLSSISEEKETSKKQLNELNSKLEEENQSLQKDLDEKKENYFQFIEANYISRSFIEAIIRGDIEKLNTLTTAELEVFEGYFKQKVGNEVIEIPYNRLRTEPYIENQVIISVHGYDFQEELLWIQYSTTHNDNRGYINLELVKEEKQWKVNSIAYDA